MSNAEKAGPQQDGRVAVPLAHPLNDRDKKNLYLDASTKTQVGDIIVLDKSRAVSLMNAGFVAVDVRDADAVQTLFGEKKAAPVEAPAEPVGNAPVEDGTPVVVDATEGEKAPEGESASEPDATEPDAPAAPVEGSEAPAAPTGRGGRRG